MGSYFKKKLKFEQDTEKYSKLEILVRKVGNMWRDRDTREVGRNRGSNHPCEPRYEIIRVFLCLDVLGGRGYISRLKRQCSNLRGRCIQL